MKFLADVNIPQSVILYLVQNQHDVLDLKKVNLLAKDTGIIKITQKEREILEKSLTFVKTDIAESHSF